MTKKIYLALTIALCAYTQKVSAQAGTLDKNFGSEGKIASTFYIYNVNNVSSVKIQTDGKIVVLGTIYNDSSSFIITRYLSNGTLDNTFSNDGYLIGDFGRKNNNSVELLMHPDGKFTIVGQSYGADYKSDLALARLNNDGSSDNTFGDMGKLIIPVDTMEYNFSAAALQTDGKIVAGGYISKAGGTNDFMVARLNNDGTIDQGFATGGKLKYGYSSLYADVKSIAFDADGKIIVAGGSIRGAMDSDFAIARIKTDGTLDETFSLDGKATIVFNNNEEQGATSVIVQKDGKILVGGTASYQSLYGAALTRLNTDGSADKTFSQDGMQTRHISDNYYVSDMVMDSTGRIFVCGYMNTNSVAHFALMSFNPDGSYNNSFGNSGVDSFVFDSSNTNEQCQAMAIQEDQKIIVAGNATKNFGSGGQIAMARYQPVPYLSIRNIIQNTAAVSVYPNPVASVFECSTGHELHEAVLTVTNALGQEVLKLQGISGISIQANLEAQEAGIYIVKLVNGNSIYTGRILKY